MVREDYDELEAQAHPGSNTEVGRVTYRGSTVSRLNRDEFQDNTIEGEAIRVLFTEMTDEQIESVGLGTPVASFVESITADRTVNVTGGLSANLGTGIFFSLSSRAEIPITLYLDRDRIEGDVFAITYSLEWFDRHPGALGHAETLVDGEVYVNEELTGLIDEAWQEDASISVWRRNIRERATSNTLSQEEETIAFTPEINLDMALLNMATFIPTGPTVPTIDQLLKILQEPDPPRLIPRWDDERKARTLYELAVEQMDITPQEYWVVAGGWGHVQKTDETLADVNALGSERAFEYAYNGSTFTRDVDDLPEVITGDLR